MADTYPTSPELIPEQKNIPSRVPWSPFLAVLYVIFIFVISQILALLLLQLFYAMHLLTEGGDVSKALENSVSAQFTFTVLAETISIGAVYIFVKCYHLPLSIIGLRKPRWSDIAYGLAAVIPYYILYLLTVGVVSSLVTGLDVNQQQQIGFNNVHGMGPLIMTFISLAILPPLAEEIMVRGFLYSSLKKALPIIPAVILTSLIFAAAHLPEGGAAGPLYIAALDTFVLSLVLIYLREKTGSLWSSITLHGIKNGIAFAALFLVHVR